MFFENRIFLLPPICLFCGAESRKPLNACQPCLNDLPILTHHCPQCAQTLSAADDQKCGACLNQPPPFDHTYALFPYEPPIVRLISALKFQHQLSHAKLLGDLLTAQIRQCWYLTQALPDVIVPIPLHPERLRERGFNQALEIAAPISRALSIPLDRYGTERIKPTLPQTQLNAIARKDNLHHAFATRRSFQGLRVAVVDDVMTTTQTMTAFCTVLKQAGAAIIHVWCAARACHGVAVRAKTR